MEFFDPDNLSGNGQVTGKIIFTNLAVDHCHEVHDK